MASLAADLPGSGDAGAASATESGASTAAAPLRHGPSRLRSPAVSREHSVLPSLAATDLHGVASEPTAHAAVEQRAGYARAGGKHGSAAERAPATCRSVPYGFNALLVRVVRCFRGGAQRDDEQAPAAADMAL
eukprot:355894-Chlamydomonas_euryale.AAC.2